MAMGNTASIARGLGRSVQVQRRAIMGARVGNGTRAGMSVRTTARPSASSNAVMRWHKCMQVAGSGRDYSLGSRGLTRTAAAAEAAPSTLASRKATNPEKYGFEEVREMFIEEYNSNAILYRHKRTGAELISVLNDDENKTFGVVLRTPPDDSKGLPHILEHSVLCGSRKYPIKEPFVELIKGSLNTFLNAFTYPDRTCYPVASANVQDFYNLVDVYMDAVFFPKCVNDKMTFEQEGWHHELDNVESEMTYKGVVFNEMKGVYSNPDNRLGREIQQALFPDNTYGVDSGGDPTVIPDLTFEEFQNFHRKYYHPSNARFWFYGDDDAEKRLQILDEYLVQFDRIEVDSTIRQQKMIPVPKKVIEKYAVSDDMPAEEQKSYVTVNWLLSEDLFDTETQLEMGFLNHLLLGTNVSPLYKTMIESGLGQALVGGGLEDELRQPTFSVGLKGVSSENVEDVEILIMETMKKLSVEGFSDGDIEAAVNTIEFSLRENNTGSFPRGLSLMLRSMCTWLYDKDPFEPLQFSKPLERFKAKLAGGEDIFRPLIKKYFLENMHRVNVELQPDVGLEKEIEETEKARLEQARSALDKAGLEDVVQRTVDLKKHQETPDNPEALKVVPTLQLVDIPKESTTVPTDLTRADGVTTLRHDLFTNQILYMQAALDMRAVPESLLPLVPLFSRCIQEFETKTRSVDKLAQDMGSKTGGISASPFTSNKRGYDEGVAYFMMRGKCTPDQIGDMVDIMQDILFNTNLDNREKVKQFVLESISGMDSAVIGRGHSIAASRLASQRSVAGFAGERLGGLDHLTVLRQLVDRVENSWETVLADLEKIRSIILRKEGLIVNLTADEATMMAADGHISNLVSALPSHQGVITPWSTFNDMHNEAITVPTQVNYIGQAANLYEDAEYRLNGSAYVINKYLGTSWLWDRVRVSGGAYGGFSSFDTHSGMFQFLSYRDPNFMKTIENYEGTAYFLKTLHIDKESLTKSIIGTIGDIDSYQLPDAKGSTALMRHILGVTDEERQLRRDQILGTTLNDFKEFGKTLDKAFRESGKARVVAVTSKDGAEQAMKEAPEMNFKIFKAL